MTLYRPADSYDRAFVVGTWASSYKHSHFAGIVSSEDWPTVMHAQIGKIVARPTVRTIVAYDRPDFLYGFICGDTTGDAPIVHYIYVKAPYRSEAGPGSERIGPRHARGLFAELGVDPAKPFLYSCRTAAVARLADLGKIPRAKFVPAAARYTLYMERERDEQRRA